MTERVIINSRQNINVIEESVTDDDNNSDLMLSEQRTGCDDLFSDNQHQISRSCATPSSISDLLVGKLQDWNFHDLRRTVFVTIDQARKYCREGQTTLAIEAYQNTLNYCTELERRNKSSGESRIELNRQISIMKLECRRRLDRMTNDVWAKKSSPSPTTNDDNRFDDIEFCKTLYQKQAFTNNDHFEMPNRLIVSRLARMIINKDSCSIYSNPVHDLPEEQTTQESLEIHLRPTRECTVCTIEQSLDQFEEHYSDQCQHFERFVCNTCVYKNTKSALEDMQSTEVVCPESGCQSVFGYNEVYQVLLKSNNRTLFEFYDRQLTYQRLEQMSEFSWCPYPGCGSGQLNERNTLAQSRVSCIKCKRMICSFHRTKWHTGMTCDEYDRSNLTDDNRTKQWLKKHSKQCPQCKSSIQKIGGCDHMSCKKCKYQFCWKCLADYRLIISQGLHRHRPTCSHYLKQRSKSGKNTFRPDACTLM